MRGRGVSEQPAIKPIIIVIITILLFNILAII